jgi:hypothetical protein
LRGYQAKVAGLNAQRGRRAPAALLEALDPSIHRALAIGRLERVVELHHELRETDRVIGQALDESGTGLRPMARSLSVPTHSSSPCAISSPTALGAYWQLSFPQR